MIEIYKTINDDTYFSFFGDMFQVNDPTNFCECGHALNTLYVFLINKLKESGLIKGDHPLLCCDCKKYRDIEEKYNEIYKNK